jgi:protein-S-isoprenylcysteine O-methyltransferase Ste14
VSFALSESRHARLVEAGRTCFRRRGLMLPIALLLLAIPSPPLWPDPALPGLLGLLIALLGQAIRSLNVGLAYIIRGGKDHRVHAEALVTQGLYAHTRNPMYLGNFFLLVGLALASNRVVFALFAVPLGLAMHWAIVAAEEDFLRAKFPLSFEDYCRRVPRWWPKMRGLAATVRSLQFDARRVLSQEYQKPIDWIGAITVIVLFNLWVADVLAEHAVVAGLMIAVLCARLGTWLASRALRKPDTTATG